MSITFMICDLRALLISAVCTSSNTRFRSGPLCDDCDNSTVLHTAVLIVRIFFYNLYILLLIKCMSQIEIIIIVLIKKFAYSWCFQNEVKSLFNFSLRIFQQRIEKAPIIFFSLSFCNLKSQKKYASNNEEY